MSAISTVSTDLISSDFNRAGIELMTYPDISISHACSLQDTSDVEFVVGGKSIHAHKTILVLRCEHFKTMFTGDWKESTAKFVTSCMHAIQYNNQTVMHASH